MTRTLALMTLGLAGSLSGCSGPGDGRLALSGAVRYAGEPVAAGTIYFEPDPSAGSDGPQGVADIADGRYRTRPEFGPVAGPQVVRVMIPPGPADDPASPVRVKGSRVGEYLGRITIPSGGGEIDLDLPFPASKK